MGNRQKNDFGFRRVPPLMVLFSLIIMVVLVYYISAGYSSGITVWEFIAQMKIVIKNPFLYYGNRLNPYVAAIGVFVFLGGWGLYLTSGRNYMFNREYGAAKFSDPDEVNKKLSDPGKNKKEVISITTKNILGKKMVQTVNTKNMLVTENIQMSINTRHTDLNNNRLIIGGSGAGKTFKFVKPNILQMVGTYICTDPKGELKRSTQGILKKYNYDVKCLNLLNAKEMKKSTRYNPLKYVKTGLDLEKLVTNFMAATKKEGTQSGDQIWDDLAAMRLQAFMYYAWMEGIEINGVVHHDFKGVMHLVNLDQCNENPMNGLRELSEVDKIFSRLEKLNPSHPAVLNYNKTNVGAIDTVRSVIISLNSRTKCLNTPEILDLLSDDEMEIEKLGVKKTVLYCVIPDNDTTYDFLLGMLYTQIIQISYYEADFVHGGELPVHIKFEFDEFANVSRPNDYDKVISTQRSRNISCDIILQNLSQLKKPYEKDWESIVGNCDVVIYLGGNEKSTHKYMSESLGKMTIDKRSMGVSRGKQGSSSINDDVIGRELMMEDEARKLPRSKCIVLINGLDPILDYKIKPLKHPLWKEMVKESKKYGFDARIERGLKKGGVKLTYIDNNRNVEELTTILTEEELEDLERKDEFAMKEYLEEKEVAIITESEIPDAPKPRVIKITYDELISLDNSVIGDTEDDNYPFNSLTIELVEEHLSYHQARIESELKEEEDGKIELSKDPQEAELYLILTRLQYKSTAIKSLLRLVREKNYTSDRIVDLFNPNMENEYIEFMVDLLLA